MISFPNDINDIVRLADWLELRALMAGDQNSSIGELTSPLRIAGATESHEEIGLRVLLEVEQRVMATRQAYPFQLRRGVLRVKPNIGDYAAYLFCLGLSYFGWTPTR